MPTEKASSWKSGSLQKLVLIAIEAFVQFKMTSQLLDLKDFMRDQSRAIKKKLPLIGILLAFLFASIVTLWGTLFVVGGIALHMVIASIIYCVGIMLFVNLVIVALIVTYVSKIFKRAVKPLVKK